SAEGIVEDAFGDVVLHHRYVLVGRSMIDRIHPPCGHDFVETALIPDGPQYGHHFEIQGLLADVIVQLLLYAVERVFRMFEQNQHRRTAAYDLPAQFGADRSARAGHHDDLFLDAALEQRGPGFDGIAAEQVSDVHFAQFFHLNASAGEVGETRQGAYGDCISREHVDDLVAPLARCGGYGQQDLL